MNVDYQVLRFDNKIKPKKIGGLGVELEQRKGSGNYDKNRTQFNIEYVGLDGHPTLASKVYQTIYTNNIHFNKGDNTNILNGCIITSGPDFFRKLGLPMKYTGRVYAEGVHAGEPVFCPDIKSEEDIPEKVLDYFNESYNFMSDLVGKNNVVYAGVHLDEDTPHMHFYFLPVVDHVDRKVFEVDKKGKRITKQIYTKDNLIKNVPVQKRDENGKAIYKTEYGKFLDSDNFWKQLGGKSSYAKIQDNYNEYMNKKGFNLDRGKVGSNRHHKDKAEYNIEVLNKQIEKLKKEIEFNKSINDIELKTNKEVLSINSDEILSPSKDILKRYKDKDVEKLINYSKEIKKENIATKNALESKEMTINKLENEIKQFKSGKTYSDKEKALANKDMIISNQEKIINEQNGIIDNLKKEVSKLNERVTSLIEYFGKKLEKAYYTIAHFLGISKEDTDTYVIENYISKVNNKYKNSNEKSTKNKDDYEL